jgi:hypothetical protein
MMDDNGKLTSEEAEQMGLIEKPDAYLDSPIAAGMTQTIREYQAEIKTEIANLEENIKEFPSVWKERRLKELKKRI